MIYIGIDLNATNMVIAAINGNDEVIREDILSCSRAVVAKELAKFTWHILCKNEPYKGFKNQPTKTSFHPYCSGR